MAENAGKLHTEQENSDQKVAMAKTHKKRTSVADKSVQMLNMPIASARGNAIKAIQVPLRLWVASGAITRARHAQLLLLYGGRYLWVGSAEVPQSFSPLELNFSPVGGQSRGWHCRSQKENTRAHNLMRQEADSRPQQVPRAKQTAHFAIDDGHTGQSLCG